MPYISALGWGDDEKRERKKEKIISERSFIQKNIHERAFRSLSDELSPPRRYQQIDGEGKKWHAMNIPHEPGDELDTWPTPPSFFRAARISVNSMSRAKQESGEKVNVIQRQPAQSSGDVLSMPQPFDLSEMRRNRFSISLS